MRCSFLGLTRPALLISELVLPHLHTSTPTGLIPQVGEVALGTVLLADLLVELEVKHILELTPPEERVSVQKRRTLHRPRVVLHLPHSMNVQISGRARSLRCSVHSEVIVHCVVLPLPVDDDEVALEGTGKDPPLALPVIVDPRRVDEDGPYVEQTSRFGNSLLERPYRQHYVLVHTTKHHLALDGGGGGQLQESHLGREHPTEKESNHGVITNFLRELITQGPENGRGVTEDVLECRNVINFDRVSTSLVQGQHVPDSGVEKLLIPRLDVVEFPVVPPVVAEVTAHHHCLLLAEYSSLHEVSLARGKLPDVLTVCLHRAVPPILDTHPRLHLDDFESEPHQHAQGAVAPREGVPKVGVLVILPCVHQGTVPEDHVVLQYGLLQESVLVRCRSHTHSHSQPPHSGLLDFECGGQHVTLGHQKPGNRPLLDQRLHCHFHLLGVKLEDIVQITHPDLIGPLLVGF
eukprot:Hpha_TRINITY_DN13710_c0_g1::TRINITY_DN13710_c0_g1_i3::g.142309::m.142309